MKILELEYEDKTTGWKLEKTKFDDFTLLVGLSGVGKTKILDSIKTLSDIARDMIFYFTSDIKWSLVFLDVHKKECLWKGEIKIENNKPNLFVSEELTRDNREIFKRDSENIFFNGVRTPKLAPYQSALSLLSREEEISPILYSFNQIQYRKDIFGHFNKPKFTIILNGNEATSPNIEDIQWSYSDVDNKLYQVYQYHPELFGKIEEDFISIFPQVEKLRFRLEQKNQAENNLSLFNIKREKTEAVLEMKERGVRNWIKIEEVSEGMFKTFVHILEAYLYPEGTVVLIDEFENSLGVNCIDILSDIMQEKRHFQFIITSHHPYIINKISPKYWKIVTRKGSVVSVKNADEKVFARSHHEAFIQLMNLKEYREGIAA